MPNIGNSDITGWADTNSIEGQYRGVEFTMPVEGSVESLTARIWESGTVGAHSIHPLIYDDSGNLVAQGTCRHDLGVAESWVTFTGLSAVLEAGSTYVAAIAVSRASGTINLRTTSGSGKADATPNNEPGDACGALTPDDPVGFSTTGTSYAIYITYSATGGGTAGGAAITGLPDRGDLISGAMG